MNLFTMFSRARAHLALTPSERALLKLLQGLVITFLVAVATQVSALASGGQLSLNQNTLLLLAGSGVAAVLAAAHKLSSASGDPLLSAAVSAVESEASKYLPLHQQAAPVAAPAPSAPAPAAADAPAAASAI